MHSPLLSSQNSSDTGYSTLLELRQGLLEAENAEEESEIADEILKVFRSGDLPDQLQHLRRAGLKDIVEELIQDDFCLASSTMNSDLRAMRAQDGSIIVFSRPTRDGTQLNITHNQLKRARDVLGVKLSEVKEKLQVSKTTVWKWEKGELDRTPARKMTEYIDRLELNGVTFTPDGGIAWSPRPTFKPESQI